MASLGQAAQPGFHLAAPRAAWLDPPRPPPSAWVRLSSAWRRSCTGPRSTRPLRAASARSRPSGMR
eukprot:12640463-Alexandrium_andersonii.AAC.1